MEEKNNKKKNNKQYFSQSDKIEIKRKIDEVKTSTVPMVAVLNNVLNDESRKLNEEESLPTRILENNNSSLLIKGNKGKLRINDIIGKSLGQRYSDITRFNGYGFGTSSFLRQSRVNKFIEYNLTMMHTSGMLIVDDILNGSNFGNEEKYEKPFSFFTSSSSEIVDEDKVKKMMGLLEPDDLETAITDTKSVSVVAKEAIYIARRDGCCAVRVIPYSSIAKNMYIKWMLKEAKIKHTSKSSMESLEDTEEYFVKDEESLLKINNFLNSIGLETLTLNTQLSQYLDLSIINSIPKSLLTKKTIKHFSTESIEDKYTKNEMEHSETFYNFASRYLSGELNRYYAYETDYDIEISNNEKKSIKGTPTFSFSYGGLKNIDYKDILSKIFSNSSKSFSLESLEDQTDNFISNLDDFNKEILKNTTFEEIYNLPLETTFNKLNHRNNTSYSFYSTESLEDKKEKSIETVLSPLELLVSNFLNSFDSTVQSNYSTESVLEGSNVSIDMITGNKIAERDIEKITERAEEEQREYRKLDRMFGSIKGEHIEIIDNTNVHYIMAGDRLMGAYQLELSSDDLQNLIMARNMIYSGSLGAGMNFNNVNVDDIDLDQTMGRLMFTDYVKPILEKYMSKDLIRNNVEIGYDLMKIMEENDMSNLAKDVSELGSSIYNYTKVNFIPAEEIIFFRNGTRGLGESLFKKAEIPAHMSILLREEYLGWVISDGKGVTFVTIPQGSSEVNGEIGMSSLFDQIDEFMSLDRTSLRNTLSTNVSLTRKFFKMVKPDTASDIKIDNIDMPEFPINTELQMLLIQEATEKVGYNSALFSSTDGNIELARKLYEMNGTKVLEIISSQKLFKKVMSQLATLLLRLRGGEEYNDVVVVWNPPLPSKINIDQRMNTITSKFDLTNKLIEVVDNIFEEDPSIGDYSLVRRKLLIKFVQDIFRNDSIFDDIESVVDKIKKEVKVDLATVVKEK